MSKGSAPRPISVSDEEYAKRWEAIFGKDKPIEPESDYEPQTNAKEEGE